MASADKSEKSAFESAVFRYSIAVCIVAAALGLSLLLHPYVSDAFIIFFLAAVMLVGWFGRMGPGLCAVVLSSVAVDYYFIPPYHAFTVKVEDLPYFLAFLLSFGCAGWLASTRKAAEEKQRVHFENLFEHGPEAIMLVDPQDRVQRVNEAFVRIFGYTSNEIVDGKSLLFIVPPFLREEALASRQKLSQGESVHLETVRSRRDGTMVHVSEIAIPVSMVGERISYYYIFRDITETRKAAEALQRAHAELIHLSRVTTMGELVASIAHEVNQPITAVVTNGNAARRWLAQQPPRLDEVQDALDHIVRDATRAGEIIGRTRALVQKEQPRPERLSINEVARSVLNLLDKEIRGNSLQVKISLDDLPPIRGDRVQLQQVLMNLIINAIEAMSDVPGSSRNLEICGTHDNEYIRVEVHDSGPGIAPESADQLFNPFFSTKPNGLGMGLAISRSIIESHGGRLWTNANNGEGILNFTLPSAGEWNETD
jgi:PAS domain S-box-containing protein